MWEKAKGDSAGSEGGSGERGRVVLELNDSSLSSHLYLGLAAEVWAKEELVYVVIMDPRSRIACCSADRQTPALLLVERHI